MQINLEGNAMRVVHADSVSWQRHSQQVALAAPGVDLARMSMALEAMCTMGGKTPNTWQQVPTVPIPAYPSLMPVTGGTSELFGVAASPPN